MLCALEIVLFGAAVLIRSTLVLAAGLAAGWLLRRRGAALRSLVYRATLVGAVLASALSVLLAGRVQAAVYLSARIPAMSAISPAPPAGSGKFAALPAAPA